MKVTMPRVVVLLVALCGQLACAGGELAGDAQADRSDADAGAPGGELDAGGVDAAEDAQGFPDADADADGDEAEVECRGDDDCVGVGVRCCEDVCVESASCAFSVTAVEPTTGWLSGGDWLTLTGAGFVEGMRVYIGEGRAPVRILDSAHATVLTPPGLAGVADVTVVWPGEQAATRHGAFSYAPGGLAPSWETISVLYDAAPRGRTPGVAVLRDGRALVAGGTARPSDFHSGQRSADLFGPPATRAVVHVANEMSAGRCWNGAVTMLTGKALVVGGCWNSISGGDVSDTADLFDPETNLFAPTSTPMNAARGGLMLATLLVDGRVLIASGDTASLEIYDPDTDSFELVPHGTLHDGGFLVRLRDGRVLLGGGGMNTALPGYARAYAEVFDSDSGEWTSVGGMAQPTFWTTAVALPDGRALVIGGAVNGNPMTYTSHIEIFDPVTDTFSLAPYSLSAARAGASSAVLLRDGTVLAIGRDGGSAAVDQIDPVNGTVTPYPSAPARNSGIEFSAARLLDGSVLVAGGFDADDDDCSDFYELVPAAP
jgi:hypothetical protein